MLREDKSDEADKLKCDVKTLSHPFDMNIKLLYKLNIHDLHLFLCVKCIFRILNRTIIYL